MNAKEKLKALCVHEVLYNKEKDVALSGAALETDRLGERDGQKDRDTVRAQEGQGMGSKGQSMGQKLCMKIVAEKVRLLDMMRYALHELIYWMEHGMIRYWTARHNVISHIVIIHNNLMLREVVSMIHYEMI
jgi:hypothetical protein